MSTVAFIALFAIWTGLVYAMFRIVYPKNPIENITVDFSDLTADEYQILAARTMAKVALEDLEYHALHGMVGEIGEIHSLYQKIYQGHEWDEEHAKKELGDLLWFIAEYCTVNGWALSDVMYLNIEKLKKRYPNGFESVRSINRKEGDI